MTTLAKYIFFTVVLLSSTAYGPSLRTAAAQELVDLLVERRHRAVAANFISRNGALPGRSPDLLPVSTKLKSGKSPIMNPVRQGSTFDLFKVRRIPKLGREWFLSNFPIQDWAFLGSNDLAPVDTTHTWRLRGMLEASYGTPTQTLTDFGYWRDLQPEQFIQFEYWFVLNNQIPFIVLDTNGPFERGVVVATDKQHIDDIMAIRNALFEPLLSTGDMKPYIDYYYDEEFDAWYKTGYDGSDLFVRPIRTSEIGNTRPVLSQN
ncbi:MAG: hypothetical protein HKN43_08095 [Rhodothermales bacterium]|nr:hypothetical protein [Rhodothermales bacterium]